MRYLLTGCLLFACAGGASCQSMPDANSDFELLQAWPAWLVGDHVKARGHFTAAARRGYPLAQYNLAMMLIHGEGGPSSPAEACALLRAAAPDVALARAALAQYESTLCLLSQANEGR